MTTPVTDASVYSDLAGLAALKRDARAQDPSALRAVAKQFESLFAKMMLTSMRKASFGDPLLGSDQQDVCRSASAKGDDKFVGVEFTVSENNLPVIANSIASIECRLYSVTEAGDHWFVMGEVLRMETVREDDPMLFHRGRYGGFAERM